jgi:LmbE family N-acetylglucosaminyl deacetylase
VDVKRREPKVSRGGRPPAGVRHGEMVRDYPQVTLRLPPEIKAKLNALSAITAAPQWRVVSAALECFFRERSQPEQQRVITYMGRESPANRRQRNRRASTPQ